MSADIPFKVKILVLEEREIEVCAVTSEEAMSVARYLPDVAKVVSAEPKEV